MKECYKRHITLIFCFLAFSWTMLSAQDIKMQCMKPVGNGTRLEWIDNIGCPPYEVYRSTTRNGVYTTIVTGIGTSFYQDANPTSPAFYYVKAACGQNSDTVDVYDPIAPKITSVSVTNNAEITINWDESTSKETMAYMIYSYQSLTDVSAVLVETVTGISTISFTHTAASAPPVQDFASKPQYYQVAAADYCFDVNQGLSQYDIGIGGQVSRHGTLLLTYTIDRCEASANLTWTAYEAWFNPVLQYVIHADNDGDGVSNSIIDTVAGSTLNYTFPGLKDGNITCFFVVAEETSTGSMSQSNTVCIVPNVVQQPEFVYVQNVSVVGESAIDIEFYIDSLSDISYFNLYRRVRDGNFGRLQKIEVPSKLDSFILYNDIDEEFLATSSYIYEYQIGAVDSCNLEHFSNISNSILLKGEWKFDFNNDLDWNAYKGWSGNVARYNIERSDDVTQLWGIEDYVENDTIYSHDINFETSDVSTRDHDGLFCYRVQAVHSDMDRDLSFKSGKRAKSYSNERCIQQDPPLYVPNAFSPNLDSLNDVFKPLPIFIDDEDYHLSIFDRWGKLMFETEDLYEGWDGTTRKGKAVPIGLYWYIIQFSNPPTTPGGPRRIYMTNGGRPSPFMLLR